MKDIVLSRWKFALAMLLPIVSFLLMFPDYLQRGTFFWICLITLPISIQKGNKNFPFFTLSLLVGAISILYPTSIGTYLLLSLFLLVLIQQAFGSLHVISLIHFFLASPFFIYLSTLISFPVRIQLTSVVAAMLNYSGLESTANGNIINLNGEAFLVDQACAGMHMLSYGILFGTLILSFRNKGKELKRWHLVSYYLLLAVLIVWGNIVRIFLLVITKVEAENWLHDGIGLLIFAFNVLLPFYAIVNRKKVTKPEVKAFHFSFAFPLKKYIVLMFVLAIVYLRHDRYMDEKNHQSIAEINGVKTEEVMQDVSKMYNGEILVYVKNPVVPYRANHNPMICWQGSGYEFNHVFEEEIDAANKVNMAELKKGNDVLYTAWWFESSQSQTSSQWDWRMKSLKQNEKFYLINVTSENKTILLKNLRELIAQKIIRNSVSKKAPQVADNY